MLSGAPTPGGGGGTLCGSALVNPVMSFSPADPASLNTADVADGLAPPDGGALLLDDDGRVLALNPYMSGLLLAPGDRNGGDPPPGLRLVHPGPASLRRRLGAARAGQPYRHHLSLDGLDGVRLHFTFRWCGHWTGQGVQADLLACQLHGLRTARPSLPIGIAPRPRQRVLDRAAFEEAGRVALVQVRVTGMPCSLLSVSIDRLPPADAAAAAWAFRQFVEGCSALLRADDLVGLVDRHHFEVLLPGALARHALRVAERLRAAMAVTGAGEAARARFPRLTLSIGIVTSRTGLSSYPALRSRADAKREDARQRGGNRING